METGLDTIQIQKELRLQRLRSLLDGLPKSKANELMIEAGLLKGKTPHKPVEKILFKTVTYKTVFKETICKHCGKRTEDIIHLHKGEETVSMDEVSSVRVLKEKEVKSGIKVKGYVNYCSDCEDYVSKLPRYELERRYMIMLKENAIRMPGTIQTVPLQNQRREG